MMTMHARMRFFVVAGCCVILGAVPGYCDEKKPKSTRVSRLFLQDHAARTLRYADLLQSSDGQFSIEEWKPIEGFPTLDPQKQTLVQMRESAGRIIVGVRDNDQGKVASGWVLLSTGSRFREHGDHGHWDYAQAPFVLESKIDTEQGNPAHIYAYDGHFYVANDSKNGFTHIDPEGWFRSVGGTITKGTPAFHSGGGNHITLAAVANRVAFATWIDGGGPNKGRVDQIRLQGAKTPSGSFTLPSGVIHGACARADKVFFAPADGICWIHADPSSTASAKDTVIHHLPLGLVNKKPLRTGAFACLNDQVLCVTGQENAAKLVIIDASAKEPQAVFVGLSGKEFHKPLTPELVLVDQKKPLALVFHDHDKKHQAEDLLEICELDPNGDGKFADARIVKTLKVGPSLVEGHYGHHGSACDADGQFVFFTNPGDGTLSILDLKSRELRATIKIGGHPTALLAHGGNETED